MVAMECNRKRFGNQGSCVVCSVSKQPESKGTYQQYERCAGASGFRDPSQSEWRRRSRWRLLRPGLQLRHPKFLSADLCSLHSVTHMAAAMLCVCGLLCLGVWEPSWRPAAMTVLCEWSNTPTLWFPQRWAKTVWRPSEAVGLSLGYNWPVQWQFTL